MAKNQRTWTPATFSTMDGLPISGWCRKQLFRQFDGEITPEELRQILDEHLLDPVQANLFPAATKQPAGTPHPNA